MDACLQHDPRTKSQIKDALFDYLYAPVKRHFKARLDTIITRNSLLGGFSHQSFVYKGEFYSCDTAAPPLKRNRLLTQLRPDMDEYLKETQAIDMQELPYVIGFINQVLNSSNDLTDYLQLLPESVHQPLDQLIATCPCKTRQLTDDQVKALRERNKASISLMKQRMVTNLLI